MTLAGRFTHAFTRTPRTIVWIARTHAALYRRSGGRFVPRWFAGAPVMVLETVGRRSGTPRATPVLYLRDGDDLVVIPSNAGSQPTPAWWLNLRAADEATAVVGGERGRARATARRHRRRTRAAVGSVRADVPAARGLRPLQRARVSGCRARTGGGLRPAW